MSAGLSIFRSFAVLLLIAVEAFAAYPKEVILAAGDPVAEFGSYAQWSDFPAVFTDEAGEIVLEGNSFAGQALVVRDAAGILTVRARSGQLISTDPASDLRISTFMFGTETIAGTRGGAVAFQATLMGSGVTDNNRQASLVADADGLRIMARQGDLVPGREDRIRSMERGRFDQNGHYTFIAHSRYSSQHYLLRWTPDGLTELFPGAGAWGATPNLVTVITRATGAAVALAYFRGPDQTYRSGILQIDPAQQSILVQSNTRYGSRAFASFTLWSCNNRGDVVFQASSQEVAGGPFTQGLWLLTAEGIFELLSTGSVSGAIINGRGDIAWQNADGLFIRPAGEEVRKIISTTTERPALAAIHRAALSFNPHGHLVFATPDAIWLYRREGQLRPLAENGETIRFRGKTHTISAPTIVTSPAGGEEGRRRIISDNGKVVFTATLTPLGGTAGIQAALVATLPYEGALGLMPVANPDTIDFHSVPGVPVPLDVLANDSDADGEPLSIVAVSAPGFGKAAIRDGRILYIPDARFAYEDTLTYRITDGQENFATSTVTVRNALHGSRGNYSATILRSSTPVGMITLSVSRLGAISGRLDIQGETFPIRRMLPPNGEFTQTFTLKSGLTLEATFVFSPNNVVPRLQGAILTSDGVDLRFAGVGALNPTAVAAKPGRITAQFRTDAASGLPSGGGFAVGTITRHHRVALVGRLPDDRAFAVGAIVGIDGTVPFACAPYGKDRGALTGQFQSTAPGVGEWTAQLQWTKAATTQLRDLFPAGVAGELSAAFAYYSARPGEAALALGTPARPIGLFQAGLDGGSSLSDTATWSAEDRIDVTLPNPNAIRLRVNRATGLVTGSFLDDLHGTARLNGAIYLPRGEAAGMARKNAAIGSFTLEQQAAP